MNSRLMLLFLFLFMSCSSFAFAVYDDSYSMLKKGDDFYKAYLLEDEPFLNNDLRADTEPNDEIIQLEDQDEFLLNVDPDSDFELGDEFINPIIKVTNRNSCFTIKNGILVVGVGLIVFLMKYLLYDKNLKQTQIELSEHI